MKGLFVEDPALMKRLIRRRRALGIGQRDEVWNGVYVMSPAPDPEHQDLATLLSAAFISVVGAPRGGRVHAGTNVSDRDSGWERNYRCPDVAVFLPGSPAQDVGTHWFGGPDFAVEIISRRDRSRKKFRFYATVRVRELLLVDRRPWMLELHRQRDGEWEEIGTSRLPDSTAVRSEVLPVSFRLVPGDPRPQVEVSRADGTQRWLV
jgi:Uma2 family endonuclease